MLDLAYRFVARKFGIPVVRLLAHPVFARIIRAFSLALRVRTPPPRGAFTTTLEWAQRPVRDERKYLEIYPATEIHRRLPKSIYPTAHWLFRDTLRKKFPPVFLATIPQGRVLGRYGAVVSGDDFILGDLSHEWFFKPDRHPLRFKLKLPDPSFLEGVCATLASPSGWNYFHWLLDVLPRFGILEKAGCDWRSIDWFVLNEGGADFQNETLGLLGIPPTKRVCVGAKTHYRCRTLLAPSLPADVPSQTQRWAVDFLRSKFLVQPAAADSRLYVSRARAKYRRFTNEAEVRQRLLQHGFREVFLEDHPFVEKVRLFASAAAIVSPHGAAMANLAFCQPNAKIIEIFSPNYVHGCSWGLANCLELDYYYLLGAGALAPDGRDPHRVEESITVDLGLLDQTLKLAGVV